MCSKIVSHVKMWSRKGVPSAESVSLTFAAHSDAWEAAAFSKFCISAEGFWLKYTNCGDTLSAVGVLCLTVLVLNLFSLLHKLTTSIMFACYHDNVGNASCLRHYRWEKGGG